MVIVRVTEEGYREVREQLGQDAPSLEEVFEEGVRSYLERPRVIKLMVEAASEERLDELLLMLAQSRASYGVIEIWNSTKGRDYAATREEYVILADEFERLQSRASRLAADVEALSREVTELEARLRGLGGDPDAVEPPFPKGVTRPPLEISTPAQKQGLLTKLWRHVSGLRKG